MNRGLTVTATLLSVAALGLSSAEAAPKKKKPKPKPITGSYTVTLPPDPSMQGLGTCPGANPASHHLKDFAVPAAGILVVKLVATDPTGAPTPEGLDWDLHILEDGGERSSSTSFGGTEETSDKFKKKSKVTINVCNLNGLPEAKVSYVFTYA